MSLTADSFLIAWVVWGVAHVAIGVFWYWLWRKSDARWRLGAFVAFTILWEVLESLQGTGGFGGMEIGLNSAVDILANLTGYYIGSRVFHE